MNPFKLLTPRRIKITLYLKGGQTIKFTCSRFKTTLADDGSGYTAWECNKIRGTYVDFALGQLSAWTGKRSYF